MNIGAPRGSVLSALKAARRHIATEQRHFVRQVCNGEPPTIKSMPARHKPIYARQQRLLRRLDRAIEQTRTDV